MASSASNPNEEERLLVFLRARSKFAGLNAAIRKSKTINKVIAEHELWFEPDITRLTRPVVISIIQNLLERQIFQDESKARKEFPEWYDLLDGVSQQKAARIETEILGPISESIDDQNEQQNLPVPKDTLKLNHSDLPSFFPSYLTYSVQHKLLNTVQRILEECCYDFAVTWIPDVVEAKGWDCPEAVELCVWSDVLPANFNVMDWDATTFDSHETFSQVLAATHKLRHAAVHRVLTDTKGLEEMLNDSLSLVKALKDLARIARIEAVLNDFIKIRQTIVLRKHCFENELDEKLEYIQEQRKKLDREEKEAKESMVRQDRENTASMSSLFEISIGNLQLEPPFCETMPEPESEPGYKLDTVLEPDQEPELGSEPGPEQVLEEPPELELEEEILTDLEYEAEPEPESDESGYNEPDFTPSMSNSPESGYEEDYNLPVTGANLDNNVGPEVDSEGAVHIPMALTSSDQPW